MRRLSLSLLALIGLAGCQQAASESVRAIDINAAAVRAQGDIDGYAAERQSRGHAVTRERYAQIGNGKSR